MPYTSVPCTLSCSANRSAAASVLPSAGIEPAAPSGCTSGLIFHVTVSLRNGPVAINSSITTSAYLIDSRTTHFKVFELHLRTPVIHRHFAPKRRQQRLADLRLRLRDNPFNLPRNWNQL